MNFANEPCEQGRVDDDKAHTSDSSVNSGSSVCAADGCCAPDASNDSDVWDTTGAECCSADSGSLVVASSPHKLPEHRVHELALLKIIAETLNQANELSTMLHSVLEKLLELTGLTTGWIFLSDAYMDYRCTAEKNLPPALSGNEGQRMNNGSCWCLDRYWGGKLKNAVNILNCKRIEDAATFKWGDTNGITHHATVPLRAGKRLVGLLNIAAPGKERFSDEELALLQSVAFQIGGAIDRIRLYAAEQQRAERFAKLDEFSRALGSQLQAYTHPTLLAERAIQLIGEQFQWPIAALYELSGDELIQRAAFVNGSTNRWLSRMPLPSSGWLYEAAVNRQLAIASREEAASLASCTREPYRNANNKPIAAVAIPLPFGSAGDGVLVLGSNRPGEFSLADRPILEALAEHIALKLQNSRLAEQRHELARWDERNRLARDLHDSVSQLLFSLSVTSRGVEGLLASPSPDTDAAIAAVRDMQTLSQSALKEMRALILQLRPADLQAGLVTGLQEYGQRLGLHVHTQLEGVREMPRMVEEALWRIGQEALNNVSKHAGTKLAYLSLLLTSDQAKLSIQDNGSGLDEDLALGDATANSIGLSTMRERAEALGGQFTLARPSDGGTLVEVRVPLPSLSIERSGGN
ncbi:GAF sensor signal transduction histidine kinase [Paenibacillus curdlanolyticus YK9]|uniref:histidine kinase n=1 Tax=Paenibacillus curdlanolyticus YK9 TaxID=717606 RepID=E0IB63_9BACL|nr:GAF domain-containing sensor histidine kinase [Paenibacillus curdlanolyticus]EFM10354.1 GAF sensor signal transduction histidine kinase [Paenibacillus curdlanolyticus YK9]